MPASAKGTGGRQKVQRTLCSRVSTLGVSEGKKLDKGEVTLLQLVPIVVVRYSTRYGIMLKVHTRLDCKSTAAGWKAGAETGGNLAFGYGTRNRSRAVLYRTVRSPKSKKWGNLVARGSDGRQWCQQAREGSAV